MEKASDYWQYESIAKTPLTDEEKKLNSIEPATKQEIGWQKKFQLTRAINHARNGKATMTELTYLANHGLYYPSTPKHLILKPTSSKRVK